MRGLLVAALAGALAGALVLSAGCSGTGAAMTGLGIGKNLSRKDSNLKVYLDGAEGKQNSLRKGLAGHAPFEVKSRVGTSPKFKYEIIDPKKLGDIYGVSMQVHQKFEADFSDIADYTIFARDTNNRDAQMKPGVEYDLANLGSTYRIMDKNNAEVSSVVFKPGVEYLLVLTLRADKSESVQIYFKTQ